MELKFNLFKNDKKGNDKAPDYRGNDMDKTHEVACWVKPMKDGKGQYLSCVLKPSTGTKPEQPTYGTPKADNVDYNDKDPLPF